MTDSSGNVIGQQGHDPFGESWYQASTTTKWTFTDYERDVESGNDYATARYQISRPGRFGSPDLLAGSIADPQSLNRYAYTRDDPVNLVDPLGLDWGMFGISPLPIPHPAQPPGREGGIGGGLSEWEDPSGACVLDGIETPCGMAYQLVNVGAADICPGNFCSGFIGGRWEQFRCSVSGICGYQTLEELFSSSNECGDHFCNDTEFDDYVHEKYEDRLKAQAKALEDKIRANCKSGAASKAACDAAVKQIEEIKGKLQGGNYDFQATLDPKYLVCESNRCDGIHITAVEGIPYIHLDTANPFNFGAGFFGILEGFFEHAFVDVFLGNTAFTVLPRTFPL